MGVKTKGIKKMQKNLSTLEKGASRRVNKLQKETSEVGLEVATKMVPKDSGELKEGIKVKNNNLVVEGVDYADDVEYGTFKSPAQPYFRPAVNAMREHIQEHMKDVVK